MLKAEHTRDHSRFFSLKPWDKTEDPINTDGLQEILWKILKENIQKCSAGFLHQEKLWRETAAVLRLEDTLIWEIRESMRRSLKVGGIETVV